MPVSATLASPAGLLGLAEINRGNEMKISSARYLALAAAASVFAVAIPGVASATETGTAAQPSASASPSSPGDPQEAPPAEEVTEQEEATEQDTSTFIPA